MTSNVKVKCSIQDVEIFLTRRFWICHNKQWEIIIPFYYTLHKTVNNVEFIVIKMG